MLTTSDPVFYRLSCHPRTSPRAVGKIEAGVGQSMKGGLLLDFLLVGDVAGLTIPASRPARQADELYRHTCFEVFVMEGQGPAYREFNFSPSGEWAMYAFDGYREGGVLQKELNPGIVVHKSRDRLELTAEIHHRFLPLRGNMRLGLSAVVEDAGGSLSYWALQHPPGKPDFHHIDAFALQLGADLNA